MSIGVYIHIPFCLRKCPYCDFYSIPFDDGLAEAYTAAVLRAIETRPCGEITADTVYFGGGTPVLLGTERIGRILRALAVTGDAEITVEANPAAAMADTLRGLREQGVNRLSLGVQSLDAGELGALGRLHGPEEARRAILDAADAGFEDISADLMLAIPGQTARSLAASIAELCALPVNHISSYLLKIEEGTPFHAQKNALPLPDEDETAERYLDCVRLLGEHGFAQYEISNFAKDGNISRHNLKYWRCGEYLGIGPAAHSFLRGRRSFFPRDLDGFLRAERPFTLSVDDGAGGGAEERILLRLRLAEGLDLARLDLAPPKKGRLLARARQLEAHGLTRVTGDNIALTTEGFLLSNSVIAALLEASGL